MFSNIVKKCYFGGFCCKVGVYYCLYSEISHQERCSEKKKCLFPVLNVLNSENKNLNLSCSFEEIVFFQNLVLKIWGRSSKGEDKGLIQVKVDVPLFRENGKIIPIYLLYLLYRCYVVKWSNSKISISTQILSFAQRKQAKL